jgi:hypothetical protein
MNMKQIGYFCTGNLSQFFAHDSWDWHAQNSEKFGRVMRIWGPLRTRILVISDPLALHYLLVKESYTYEFPSWLSEYVSIIRPLPLLLTY